MIVWALLGAGEALRSYDGATRTVGRMEYPGQMRARDERRGVDGGPWIAHVES